MNTVLEHSSGITEKKNVKIGLFLTLLLIAVLTLTGCGKDATTTASTETIAPATTAEDAQSPAPQTTESAPKAQTLEVDDAGNVIVTIPAIMFEGQNIDDAVANAKKNGIDEVTKNQDGSLVYKMTKTKHQDMIKEFENDTKKIIGSLSTDYPSIKEVTYNESFSEFTLTVDQQKYTDGFDNVATIQFGIDGYYHQLFNGVSTNDAKVTFSLKNADTGTVFSTVVYPDTFK